MNPTGKRTAGSDPGVKKDPVTLEPRILSCFSPLEAKCPEQEMADSKISELQQQLQEALMAPEKSDFTALLNTGMLTLMLIDQDIAHRFDMSRPSVGRWRSGKATPHVLTRKVVYRYLNDRCVSVLKMRQEL